MELAALNGICPYYTMYPLEFPLRVLQRTGKAGEWVLDPFCGRGTTNFAARLLGMPSIGVDSSPVAAALAKSKLANSTPAQVVASARAILNNKQGQCEIPAGKFWELAYHQKNLHEICLLRAALLADCSSPTRILLRAIILGALHGPRPKGKPSYFSNQSPRTFAPKPGYAVKYWTEHKLLPEATDVLAIISARANRYLSKSVQDVDGIVKLADSREPGTFRDTPKLSWVVTSPPYYGMRTYLPDQWLRHWFLGGSDHVVYSQPRAQLEHSGPKHFAGELATVWRNVAKKSLQGARLIIRFGGIHDRDVEPMEILRRSLADSGWVIVTAKRAPDADGGRRQVRQFQTLPKKSITEHDVYCRLA
jgi:hypothetical protein